MGPGQFLVTESHLKMIKNAFNFILKAFVLEIVTFMFRRFGYVEKWLGKKAITSQAGQQIIAIFHQERKAIRRWNLVSQ